MIHADWAAHDIDELLECEVMLADHIADGSVAADSRHLELIADLESEIILRRHQAGERQSDAVGGSRRPSQAGVHGAPAARGS